MSVKSTARKNKRINYRTKVLAWAKQGFAGKLVVLADQA